ncbi:condensation domain-containing protein [Chitinophaga sp. LS1]|uniref:condensation domain-containing protein n=1 Tax=Chitinophaga sp. LS1 TaxID=3051176 RepID=UPI002AAB702E|nr:condensation domain-containing protein [Chitinophaga sp. LS1]WPV66536.1 condensation domain-containing protein [Chitinophaga sp. LS1]
MKLTDLFDSNDADLNQAGGEDLFLNSFVKYVAPTTETEFKLEHIFKSVLGIQSPIGVNDDFFDNGGHSLAVIKLISEIYVGFQYELSIKEIIDNSTILKLSKLLATTGTGKDVFNVVREQDENGKFPLSQVQLSYLLGRDSLFELGGVSTQAYQEFVAAIDFERFSQAFNDLIARHSMLRAVITEDGSQQIVVLDKPYEIVLEDYSRKSQEEIDLLVKNKRDQLSHKIFNTAVWPLFDLQAIQLPDNKYYFFWGIDTIIADAQSKFLLYEDLFKLYEGKPLKDIEFTFRDYMLTLENLRNSARYQSDKQYWLNKLSDFPLAPALPLKAGIKKGIGVHFNKLTHQIKADAWATFKKNAAAQRRSPTSVLCAIFSTVLAAYCNQNRFSINLTVFNRLPFHKDVNEIVGDFTSLLLLDVDVKGRKISDTATHINDQLLQSLDHRLFDGVEFIRELAQANGNSIAAMMPVVFTSALYGKEAGDTSPADVADRIGVEGKYSINQSSQVLLDCIASDISGITNIQWNYVEDMFDAELVSVMFNEYVTGIENYIKSTDGNIIYHYQQSHYKAYQVLNNTAKDVPATDLVTLFNHSCQLHGEKIALKHGTHSLTYAELDQRSNQCANYLLAQGVTAGDKVGIYSRRVIDTIVYILGILKAGAAYVPFDQDAPAARVSYLQKDCNCKLTLGQSDLMPLISTFNTTPINTPIDPQSLAYIIYTSGSTGNPKGVAINHDAVCNTVLDINDRFHVNDSDSVLGISSLTFDLSVYDIFGTFSCGARLVLLDDIRDTQLIIQLLNEEQITVWNSVPAIMELIVDEIQSHSSSVSAITDDHEAVDQAQSGDNKLYWAPQVNWERKDNTVYVEGNACPDFMTCIFPDFYYYTKGGATRQELSARFIHFGATQFDAFLARLIQNKVLISAVQQPDALFASQERFVKKDPRLAADPVALLEYTESVLNRNYSFNGSKGKIQLDTKPLPDYITNRKSWRSFSADKMSLGTVAGLLSVLKQEHSKNDIRYHYASAGGLYPIDVYLLIKPDRVLGMEGGLYYYQPQQHTLIHVHDGNHLMDGSFHNSSNAATFHSSAVTAFLVYNAENSMPKYGGYGYFMATLDAGIMTEALAVVGETLDVGFCSIGHINFDMLSPYLFKGAQNVLLHTIELGLKENIPPKVNNILSAAGKAFNLKTVMMSGDWIPVNLPLRISHLFKDASIYSLGGATEASIWSNFHLITLSFPYVKSIPYGRPLSNQQFYVLNPFGDLCAPGVEGDLYIGGRGLAACYYNDKDKTDGSFITHPSLGRIYKTGDLGILHKVEERGTNEQWSGNIEFIGRKDSQVKIRGYRIELGEVEGVLQEMQEVLQCVVVVKKDTQGVQRLIAYVVVAEVFRKDVMMDYLRSRLPEYMLPSMLIRMDHLPLTSNGKVDRKNLPIPDFTEIKNTYQAPANKTEQQLTTIIGELLNIENISTSDNFFERGGNSIIALKVVSRVRQLGLAIQPRDLFQFQDIRSLAEHLHSQQEKQLVKKLAEGAFPVTPTQRYWLDNTRDEELKKENGNNFGPIKFAYEINSTFNPQILKETVKLLTARHEILRAVFDEVGNAQFVMKLQPVMDEVQGFEYVDLRTEGNIDIKSSLYDSTSEFNFQTGPLFFTKVYQQADNSYVVLFEIHHVVFDKWSIGIFFRDLFTIYDGLVRNKTPELPVLNHSYSDYLKNMVETREQNLAAHKQYWQGLYNTLPPDLPIPVEQLPSSGKMADRIAEIESLSFPDAIFKSVMALSREHSTSFSVVLQAAFLQFMHSLTEVEDLCFGTDVFGRDYPDSPEMIGCFAETVLLRVAVHKQASLTDTILQVKKAHIDTDTYQAYTLTDLVVAMLPAEREMLGGFWRFNMRYRTGKGFHVENNLLGEDSGVIVKAIPNPREKDLISIDMQIFFVNENDQIKLEVTYDSSAYTQTAIREFFEKFIAYLLQELGK